MKLWLEWFRCVSELRSACTRNRTFLWMILCLTGLSTRPERTGVTSLVRILDFRPKAYFRLLHLFHSTALNLETLTGLWVQLVFKLFKPVMAGPYRVFLVDGIKIGKEGKKMPAVKQLHQSSGSNTKSPYIMGHSFEAVSLLVRGKGGGFAAIPLIARIHEGLIWSNRDQRSLLDKMVNLFLPLTKLCREPVILIADAYYASRKVILPLLKHGHHLVTRARSNTVAYWPASKPDVPRRGRPRVYGEKVRLRNLAEDIGEFETAPSPCYCDIDVTLLYRSIDLMWKPVGRIVRFVLVHHPRRGSIYLLSSNLELEPLQILELYSHRFKIEVGFKHALHVIGSYAYHFWMKCMTPISRGSGNQYMHCKSKEYRNSVRRKMKAYHLHVQLGCIAQGLLLHLSMNYGNRVWKQFRGWLRTMNPDRPPSELVTAQALRDCLPEFLDVLAQEGTLRKLLKEVRRRRKRDILRKVA